jgi:hypothetical protein
MALAQKKHSADGNAPNPPSGADRFFGIQGGANVNFSVTQIHTLVSFTASGLPSAAANPRRIVWCSDGNSGLPCLAISDGTNWRLVFFDAMI